MIGSLYTTPYDYRRYDRGDAFAYAVNCWVEQSSSSASSPLSSLNHHVEQPKEPRFA